jgi:hypothetical protein
VHTDYPRFGPDVDLDLEIERIAKGRHAEFRWHPDERV